MAHPVQRSVGVLAAQPALGHPPLEVTAVGLGGATELSGVGVNQVDVDPVEGGLLGDL